MSTREGHSEISNSIYTLGVARQVVRWRSQGRRLVPIVAMALLMAACGSGDNQDASGPTQQEGPEGGDPATVAADEDGGGEQQGCEEFFANETVELVVTYGPGGGYDTTARILAPFLEEELGEGATVHVVNQEGAGGMLAANVAFAAEPDGTHLILLNGPGVLAADLGGQEGIDFTTSEFSWIGRASGEPSTAITAADGPIDSWDDLIALSEERPVRFGAHGPGTNEYIATEFVRRAFDLNVDIVTGFESREEIELAILQGDLDASISSLGPQIPGIEAGEFTSILSFAEESHPAIPETPVLLDFDLEEDYRKMGEALNSLIGLGRTLAGPPGMDEDVVSCLRDAFMRAVQNPDLKAEAESRGQPFNPLPGDELVESFEAITNAPPAFQEFIQDAFE